MTDRHYAGVYWEDRPASKQEVSRELVATLSILRSISPLLGRWHLQRETREDSLAAELTAAGGEAIVIDAIVPIDAENPRHGWKVRLWNGLSEKYATPQSLGLIGEQQFTVRKALDKYDAATVNRATYAVSLEPEGGSKTGVPTGPVLFTGKLVQATPPSISQTP